jgi:hypothetical protein
VLQVCILCFNREGQLFGKARSRMAEFKHFLSQKKTRSCVSEDSSDFVDGDVTSIVSRRLARLTCKYQEHITGEKSSVVDLVKSPIAVPLWQIPKDGLVCKR